MEKISGILPEKPRLRAEKESLPPVRPGAPAFGRAEGSSEIRDRVTLSSMKNIGPQEFQNYKNPKEAKHVKIVEDLSRKFFMSPAQTASPTPESMTPAPRSVSHHDETPPSTTRQFESGRKTAESTEVQSAPELYAEISPSYSETVLVNT